MEGGAVPAPLGEEHGREPPADNARLPRAAAAHVPGRPRGRAGPGNEIVIDFADPGSVTIDFLAKEPGAEVRLGAAQMVFRYQDSFRESDSLEGYERLILAAMLGNQALFTDAYGIERLWEVSAPLQQHPPKAVPYPRGSWGPENELRRLAAPHRWHLDGTARPAQ